MSETSKITGNILGNFVKIVSSVKKNMNLYLSLNLLLTLCSPLQIYTGISNKVVGVLLRARKHKFVDFEGETLFQASSLK
jgi:hypothetical protein